MELAHRRRDVSQIDSTAKFLGEKTRLPVFLAPIGGLESIVEGGAATAAQFGVPQMLSSVCQPGLEETAKAAKTVRSFQLYVRGDDAWVDDFVICHKTACVKPSQRQP